MITYYRPMITYYRPMITYYRPMITYYRPMIRITVSQRLAGKPRWRLCLRHTWNCANMAGLHLNQVNLEGAILTETNLKSAVLNEVTLRDANLHQVNLTAANASGSNFQRTNLRESILTNADFSNSTLSDADLSESTATGTRFVRADLMGATFDNWLTDDKTDFKDAIAPKDLTSKVSQMDVQNEDVQNKAELKTSQLPSDPSFRKTVLIKFTDGIDWHAVSGMLQLLGDQYDGQTVGIHSIETMQDYGLRMYLTLPDQVSAIEFKQLAWEYYNHWLKKLELTYLFESRTTEEEMLVHRRDNANLLTLLERVASSPTKAIAESAPSTEALPEQNKERSPQTTGHSKRFDKEPVSPQTPISTIDSDGLNHHAPSVEGTVASQTKMTLPSSNDGSKQHLASFEDGAFDASMTAKAEKTAEADQESNSSQPSPYESIPSDSDADTPDRSIEDVDEDVESERRRKELGENASDDPIENDVWGIDAYVPPVF